MTLRLKNKDDVVSLVKLKKKDYVEMRYSGVQTSVQNSLQCAPVVCWQKY